MCGSSGADARKLKRCSEADEFMERVNAYSSYEDIVRLASEYVELTGVAWSGQADSDLADDERRSVFLLDPASWKILDANQTAAERLGYSVQALTRMSVGDLASPPRRSEPKPGDGRIKFEWPTPKGHPALVRCFIGELLSPVHTENAVCREINGICGCCVTA